MARRFVGIFLKDTIGRMKDSVPTILYYAKIELTPPKPTDYAEIKQGFCNVISAYRTKSYRNLTVKEAWLNTLIGVEVVMWFFVGEVIGRGSIYGYYQKL